MKVLGVDFGISEEHIDSEQMLVIPGDGVIMPIMIDKVPNLFNFLAKHKNVVNKKPVKLFYIFLTAETSEGVLCARYIDGEVYVIQHLGEIIIGRHYIT